MKPNLLIWHQPSHVMALLRIKTNIVVASFYELHHILVAKEWRVFGRPEKIDNTMKNGFCFILYYTIFYLPAKSTNMHTHADKYIFDNRLYECASQ